MTITEFLLSRIAEDEADAKRATPGPWRYRPHRVPGAVDDPNLGTIVFRESESGQSVHRGVYDWVVSDAEPDDDHPVTGSVADALVQWNAEHIARHDPARVLAECEAKRAIIEAARDRLGGANWRDAIEFAMRQMAVVYADHPDFRDDWRS